MFMAEQTESVRRQVALKIIKLGMDMGRRGLDREITEMATRSERRNAVQIGAASPLKMLSWVIAGRTATDILQLKLLH